MLVLDVWRVADNHIEPTILHNLGKLKEPVEWLVFPVEERIAFNGVTQSEAKGLSASPGCHPERSEGSLCITDRASKHVACTDVTIEIGKWFDLFRLLDLS